MEKTLSLQNTELPDLPKKHRKREASFGLDFRASVEDNPPELSCQFELKDTRGKDYFPFAELKQEQINHALRSKTPEGNLIRIVNGTPGAPDYVFFRNCKYAFFLIRYPDFIARIDVHDFLKERDSSKKKSLTSERARVISK